MSLAEELPTPSPFIDGTNSQFAWDATSIGWAKTCPRLYQYSMIEGWRPKGESVHLRFGIEYHQSLQHYDELMAAWGVTHYDAIHLVVKDLLKRLHDYPEPDQETAAKSAKLKTKHNLVRTVVWYLDTFQHDSAQTLILKNGSPAVEVNFRLDLAFDKGPYLSHEYILCGYLDRIVMYNDELFIMDRKTTTTTLGSYYFDQYEPDNQMTAYALAGQIILKTPIRGVIIDAAQVAVTFSRFVRGITYRTQDQLVEWRTDLEYLLRSYEEYAQDGYWPQNDTACDKYGGCKFRNVCSKSPSVRQAFLESDFHQEDKWNPLETR